jgi:hypothetical protein
VTVEEVVAATVNPSRRHPGVKDDDGPYSPAFNSPSGDRPPLVDQRSLRSLTTTLRGTWLAGCLLPAGQNLQSGKMCLRGDFSYRHFDPEFFFAVIHLADHPHTCVLTSTLRARSCAACHRHSAASSTGT